MDFQEDINRILGEYKAEITNIKDDIREIRRRMISIDKDISYFRVEMATVKALIDNLNNVLEDEKKRINGLQKSHEMRLRDKIKSYADFTYKITVGIVVAIISYILAIKL